jgi:hypothetical protein
MWESLQRVVPKEVLGDPRIVGRCIVDLDVDMNNQFSLRWIRAMGYSGRTRQAKQEPQVSFNEPCRIERRPRWQHSHNME